MIKPGAQVIALAHALQVDRVDAIGLQNGVELIETPKGLVALDRDIPTVAPPRRQRKLSPGLERTSPTLVAADGGAKLVAALIDGGHLDGVLTVRELVAEVTLPEDALLGPILRVEGEIVIGRQGKIVWHLDAEPERARVGVAGRQEAGPALDRWVGVLEVGDVQHRHAEELKLCVLVADGGFALVVNDAGRADAPQRWHAGIILTGCEFAAFVLGHVAFAAAGAIGGNARVIAQDDAQRLHKGVPEIVEGFEAVRPRDAAVGVLQLGIALGEQLVDALVVDHPLGGQNVVVVVDFNVALGDHPA